MRIRVYLDRTDHLWRVCGIHAAESVGPARVAAEVQARRIGIGYQTWALAQAAADRMATRNRRQAWLRDEYPTGVTQGPL